MKEVHKKVRIIPALLIIFTLSLLSACSLPGGKSNPGNIPGAGDQQEPGQNIPPEKKLNLAVYYVKTTADDIYLVREVHEVPYTKEVARAALNELISGAPKTPGAYKVLPPATVIRGISIRNGMAVVDFSRDVLHANVGAMGESLGLQSIVNTLTEFPSIQKISFLVEGKLDQEARDWWGHVGLYQQPFTRNLSRVYEPVIWVTEPVPGQKITSPVKIKGTARVFEATVNARLLNNEGKILATGFATASEGAPGRGDFILNMPFNVKSNGNGRLEVFWGSPKDGRDLDKVIIPVNW